MVEKSETRLLFMNMLFIEAILRDTKTDGYHYQAYRGFILLWMLLDTWLGELSKKPTTRDRIDWFKSNPNYLKDYWKEILVEGYGNVIFRACPVYDKRFEHKEKKRTYAIANPLNPDVGELLEVLNVIRGNLIHGKEDITNDNNVNLYGACSILLHKWLNWTYGQACRNGYIK